MKAGCIVLIYFAPTALEEEGTSRNQAIAPGFIFRIYTALPRYCANTVSLFDLVGIQVVTGIVALWSYTYDITFANCAIGRIIIIPGIIIWG